MITGCTEIINSGYIATSSLDTYIRIWRPENFELITELRDVDAGSSSQANKVLGITSIDYSRHRGGFLVSTSFTNYVNLWCPDASLSKSFSGRLEGHSSIVINCKIFSRSTQCISLDQIGDIKLWDLGNLICMQTFRVDG